MLNKTVDIAAALLFLNLLVVKVTMTDYAKFQLESLPPFAFEALGLIDHYWWIFAIVLILTAVFRHIENKKINASSITAC